MLKKLLCAAAVFAALTTAAGAETIAEYDFGKEVLRVQGEDYTECEHPELGSIQEHNTWDAGKALKVTNDYSQLPADDADGKVTYTYKVNVPYTGEYKVMFQASGAIDNNYHSQWDLSVDGQPTSLTKTKERTTDITTIHYYTGRLEAGEHTLCVNVSKAARGGSGDGRFYFIMDYIDFHYYYDIEHDFTNVGKYDSASSHAAYGPSYGEFAKFTAAADNKEHYASFDITALKAGYYVIDFQAQQEDHGSISRFKIDINDKSVSESVIQKLAYGTPAYAANTDRQFFRNYRLTTYLNEGVNKLKFTALNERTNRWLLMDKLTVSDAVVPEEEKVRIEGENAYNAADVYAKLTHGAASLIGYREFSQGIALQTYGAPTDGSETVELKYHVTAPKTGAYNMGLLCNAAGSDFDMEINNIKYSKVRAGSTRTTNAIAAANSKAASDMFLYSYNNMVYLNKGENEVTVKVLPRSEDGQCIVDIDYFDFNLKEEGANTPELSINNVVYNGFDTAPGIGNNSVDFMLSNTSPFDASEVCVIVAVYSDGELKNAYIEKAAVNAGAEEFVSINGLNYEDGDSIKIFAWRMADLKPFAKNIYTYVKGE